MEYKLINIKGVGPKVLKSLYKNNIFTPYQLLLNVPKKYDTYKVNDDISYIEHNKNVTLVIKIANNAILNRFTKTPLVTFDFLFNETLMKAVAFNQPYLVNSIKVDDEYLLSGKFDFYKNQVVVSKIVKENNFKEIIPVYNLTDITDHTYNNLVMDVFNSSKVNIYENIPNNILLKYNLVSRENAYKILHKPKKYSDINIAVKRLKYEEAYLFSKNFKSRINVKEYREPIKYDLNIVKEVIKKIPYELTNDQKLVVNDIFKDYKETNNTFRLIQGDVGSGKTVVSLLAILGMITAGKQVAFMAPTELLARQQYEFFKSYLTNYSIALLTSKTKGNQVTKEKLKNGQINLVVGTHSVASKDVIYQDLGLVIIDEQHKFGVNIRKDLLDKGNASLIYLTATPIPRTLAITLFGDALISKIKEKPANRKPVKTKYINDNEINKVITEIKETIKRNEKVYIVVPAIDSEHSDYNILNMEQVLKDNDLLEDTVVLHGKLKEEDKDNAIESFIKGSKNIILATSMVEVGLDVKDATLMVIMNAEFFGLSQLHQLRGRVGRSSLESKTFLVGTGESKERLEILTKTDDGFKLSEFDLKERGPGSLIGLEQSGNIKFNYLDFSKDFKIIEAMHQEVNKVK